MWQKIALLLCGAAVMMTLGQEEGFLLADNVESFLDAPLRLGFSCDGREYGYYADVDNNCQVFHICLPEENDYGEIIKTRHWSFVCGNGTMFDQQLLVCNYPEDSLPCDQAESFYNLIEFGKLDDEDY